MALLYLHGGYLCVGELNPAVQILDLRRTPLRVHDQTREPKLKIKEVVVVVNHLLYSIFHFSFLTFPFSFKFFFMRILVYFHIFGMGVRSKSQGQIQYIFSKESYSHPPPYLNILKPIGKILQ